MAEMKHIAKNLVLAGIARRSFQSIYATTEKGAYRQALGVTALKIAQITVMKKIAQHARQVQSATYRFTWTENYAMIIITSKNALRKTHALIALVFVDSRKVGVSVITDGRTAGGSEKIKAKSITIAAHVENDKAKKNIREKQITKTTTYRRFFFWVFLYQVFFH